MQLPHRLGRKLAVALSALVASALLAWTGSVLLRARGAYRTLKEPARGWSGEIHRADPELGLCTVPGARGDETFPIGPSVPSRIDADGFRVPLDAPEHAERRAPIVLALGCSFTFGSACLAEDAFPYRVASALGGTALNAGLCSAGAAQMLLLARRLIPREKPDVVLVQYSSWLVERSRARFAPTYLGLIPTPYFVEEGGAARLAGPDFSSLAFSLPIEEYRASAAGLGDFASFCARVAFPLSLHDDGWSLRTNVARALRSEPPIASAAEIEAAVWPEIASLCSTAGARMVIVAFREPERPVPRPLLRLHVPIAQATEKMMAALPPGSPKNAFSKTFTHWRGDPPVPVDPHPNPRAHAIVAEEILRALREGH